MKIKTEVHPSDEHPNIPVVCIKTPFYHSLVCNDHNPFDNHPLERIAENWTCLLSCYEHTAVPINSTSFLKLFAAIKIL